MGAISAIMGGVISIFFYALVVAAVWKLFQIGTELGEIKTLLADMRRTTAAPPAPVQPVQPAPMSLESAEALLRQVAAEPQVAEPAKPVV